MKRFFKSLLFITILSPVCYGKPMKIVVDPGHGGIDSGALWGKYREADITLAVSKKLYHYLKNDKNFQVLMTRNQNNTVMLSQRSELANTGKADLFVSIHVNSNPDHNANGAEFYFQNELPADEEALFLANRENAHRGEAKALKKKSDLLAILDDMNRTNNLLKSYRFTQILRSTWKNGTNAKRRSIRQAPFHVLSEVEMPSVLVELGFITNRNEAKKLNNPLHQNQLARLIYKSIKEYKDFIDNKNQESHISSYAKR